LSKSTIRLRKVGISTLAVAMSLGVAGVTASAASAAVTGAPLGLSADSAPDVVQGAPDQAAGNLTYGFSNNWTTGATVTFTLPATCDTQANIDKAVEYSQLPSVTVTHDNTADTSRVPTFTETLGSSGSCATVGIQNVLTVTLTQPSSGGTAADQFDINLSDISYNVGKSTPTGAVTVTSAANGITSTPVATTADNANVVNKSFMFVPLVSANPNQNGVALGTATYSESSAGAYFAPGDNTVTLTVNDGVFTPGITPKIAVPTGYTVKDTTGTVGTPKTTDTAGAGSTTYQFVVTAPSTPVAAQVTVSGLEFNTGSAVDQALLDSVVQQPTPAGGVAPAPIKDLGNPAVNVVNYGPSDRIGGANRYETAARLFTAGGYTTDVNGNRSVVLSGGEKFPDALSANYLAGYLGTGTMLTHADSLPDVVKNVITDKSIDTVYITGGYAAVSKQIEDQLTAMHVGGNVNNPNFVHVVRLAGQNRYETNQRVNQYVTENSGGSGTVLFAAGTAPYDSLAGGPVAYAKNYALVLTGGTDLNRGEEQQLRDLGAQTVVILGGTGVVSQDEQDTLTSDGFNVVRLAGDTRYGTAAQIATWASEGYDFNGDKTLTGVEAGQGFTSAQTDITNGKGFADALAAGPLAGQELTPMLLSQGADKVGDETAAYLAGKTVSSTPGGTTVGTLEALGLTGATSSSMIEAAAQAIETQ